ncbi:hypothetical protein B0H10DRAFT_2022936 [Mycena sp. CBHHK59/15]|nr:hypothetical protein B0H10DRAFT_2022936 [Mycena sp. CBHHK59/15]
MQHHLPDEIISEILSPVLIVPDALFSDTSTTSPFALTYSGQSTSTVLLVCKTWLRVATPLLYNVVVLRSKAQASALEAALKSNEGLGWFIKKLRVEGGYGAAMYTVLKFSPNVTDLAMTTHIWSSDSVSGLCRGLLLIDPRRLIVLDVSEPRTNKQASSLMETLSGCISKWKNLIICELPFFGAPTHIRFFASAIARSRTLETLLLPPSVASTENLSSLCMCPSIKLVQIKAPLGLGAKAQINAHPRLRKIVRYADERPSGGPGTGSKLPEIPPSLNPFFVPMGKASQETRDLVWKRLEEITLFDRPQNGPPLPSLIPLLLLSKHLHTLALPYFYRYPSLKTATVEGFSHRLNADPSLGSFMHRLYIPPGHLPDTISDDVFLSIFSHADRLQIVAGHEAPGLHRYAAHGLTQRRITGHLSCDDLKYWPKSFFAGFSALRSLTLWSPTVQFPSESDQSLEAALPNLGYLRLECCHPSLLELLSRMNLGALRRFSFSSFLMKATELPALRGFFARHGSQLVDLRLDCEFLDHVDVFGLCNQIRTLTLDTPLDITITTGSFVRKTRHTRLKKLITVHQGYLMTPAKLNTKLETQWTLLFETLSQRTFPALREVQVSRCVWPLNEHGISKSIWVRRAEMLLAKGINLTDEAGQHWIPRLKGGGSN